MSFDDLRGVLRSVSAIPVTPFAADGSVDYAAYGRLVERLAAADVGVVTPNGNTSEFYALTPTEVRRAVECTTESAGPRMAVMAGVAFDISTAVGMGRAAQRAGATMVMVHQPVHPYQSAEGWVAYHRAIAQGLPELGVVPYVRDPNVTAAMLTELADECPNLVGVKYAVPNPLQFAAVADGVGDRVTWICGLAELWAPSFWLFGARGFTSGLVNVDPAVSMGMLRALQRSDYEGAMRLWRLIRSFEDLRARRATSNNVSVVKEALAQMGLCSPAVRPPISQLPTAEREEVRTIIAGWHAARVGSAAS